MGIIVQRNKLGCVGRVIVIGCINNTHTFQTTAGLEQCHQCHEIAMVPCTWSSFHKPSVQVCVFMWNRNKLDSLSIFFSSQLLIIEFHIQYDASAPESYQIYTNDTCNHNGYECSYHSLVTWPRFHYTDCKRSPVSTLTIGKSICPCVSDLIWFDPSATFWSSKKQIQTWKENKVKKKYESRVINMVLIASSNWFDLCHFTSFFTFQLPPAAFFFWSWVTNLLLQGSAKTSISQVDPLAVCHCCKCWSRFQSINFEPKKTCLVAVFGMLMVSMVETNPYVVFSEKWGRPDIYKTLR